jgi:hypothetical protein
MQEKKKPRRGIQSVEIAFRILSVMQSSQQAMALKNTAPLAGLTASAANVSIAAPVLDWNGDVRFTLSLAGTRASIKTESSSDQVKALLDSSSRATHALGGKAEVRD